MKKHLITTAIATAVLALGAGSASTIASAGSLPTSARIAPLTLHLSDGHAQRICTHGLPQTPQGIAPTIRIDGQSIQASSAGAWMAYYVSNGTMAQVRSYPGNGPVCVKGITWMPRMTVRVAFTVG